MDEATLKQLIDDAEAGKPELPESIQDIQGYSSPRVRRLLNALCSQPGAVYLEIGVCYGSTFIPAVYGNEAQATCIDHWQMFKGSREKFDANCAQHIPGREFTALSGDCFSDEIKAQVPHGVTVYFYDGAHDREAHYNALMQYAPFMADQFVLVIDDWNWSDPNHGAKQAFWDWGFTRVVEFNLEGAYNGDQAGWWNGLYVGLIEKQSKG